MFELRLRLQHICVQVVVVAGAVAVTHEGKVGIATDGLNLYISSFIELFIY